MCGRNSVSDTHASIANTVNYKAISLEHAHYFFVSYNISDKL